MSTIVDSQIQILALSDRLIEPFNPRQINPASYDVRLGSDLYVEKSEGWVRQELPYMLRPGEFVLGCTEELISLPNYIEAQFQLKSSRGREGYEHVMSGYIDPGYSGRLTLELVNVNRNRQLPLEHNMLIGQLRFMKTDQPCRHSYAETGHYNNDMTTQPSKVDIFGNPLTSTNP